MVRPVLAVLALSCLPTACRQATPSEAATPSPETQEAAVTTGRRVAETLRGALFTQLQAALAGGDLVKAVEVCSLSAEVVTRAAAATEEGVAMRRTTTRPRNPSNAPDTLDREVLTTLAEHPPGERPEEVLRWTDTHFRFYQPLVTQELCLRCHGDPESFSEELREILAASYPDDQATGYQAGDFRGAIRVDLPRADSRTPAP